MIVFGDIDSINGNIAKVKVSEHSNTMYDCFMLQPLTGKNKIDLPYAKGDQVCCFLSDGRNVIIGSIYNDSDKRDTEAGDDTYLFSAKKLITKTTDETKMRASKFDIANSTFSMKDLFVDLKTILTGFKVICGVSGSPSTAIDPATTALITGFEQKYSNLLK
jgi:hypothetical protein